MPLPTRRNHDAGGTRIPLSRRRANGNEGNDASDSQKPTPLTGKRRTARQPEEPQVPQYDLSDGYPKGLPNGEGPAVMRTVNGRQKLIHGVPYEALNETLQEDLDRNPLDDAGQLRIFVKDTFYGEGSYIEMGSEEHASKFMQGLRERGKNLL